MSGEGVIQRAREFAGKNYEGLVGEYPSILDAMVAFAESESSLARKQEREECAKLVCEQCKNGDAPLRYSNKELGIHAWYHADEIECAAVAIHERGRKVEG